MIALIENGVVYFAGSNNTFFADGYANSGLPIYENTYCWKVPNDDGIIACASDEGAVSDMLRFDPDLVRGELTKEQIEHYVIPRIKDKLGGMGKLSEDGDSRSEIFLAQKDRCYKISKEFCCIEIERDEDTCHIEDIVTSFCTERTDLEIIERIRQACWTLVKIYADEGISGTSLNHRDGFNEMIADCKAGKIDMIITKSVSRFARNIVDCISMVQKLAAMSPPVGIFFETESIFSLKDESSMALSFQATMAQEESHSKSRCMEQSLRMRLDHGIPLTPDRIGFRKDKISGKLYVSKKEAAPVKAELLDIIHEVQDIVRDDFTFQFTFIGSSSRNMI